MKVTNVFNGYVDEKEYNVVVWVQNGGPEFSVRVMFDRAESLNGTIRFQSAPFGTIVPSDGTDIELAQYDILASKLTDEQREEVLDAARNWVHDLALNA